MNRFLITCSLLSLSLAPVQAGNLLITGHDADDHSATSFLSWGITYLANNGNGTVIPAGPTASPKIAFLGSSDPGPAIFGPYQNYTFYDVSLGTWTNAFTDGNGVLIVGNNYDYQTSATIAALAANASLFSSYLNSGGNLFVLSEDDAGSSGFFNFLPAFGSTTSAALPGCSSGAGCFAVTPAGVAAGLTDAMTVEASVTHNRFPTVDPAFTVLERYEDFGNGPFDAITIGCVGCQAGGGGFTGPGAQVPEPTSFLLMGGALSALLVFRKRIHVPRA